MISLSSVAKSLLLAPPWPGSAAGKKTAAPDSARHCRALPLEAGSP